MIEFYHRIESTTSYFSLEDKIMKMETRPFGLFLGKEVKEYRISNDNGYTLAAINYGATLSDFIAPDKTGTPASILLGMEDLSGYIQGQSWYLGAAIGPFGNRIANATFSIGSETYKLTSNNGTNNLHSGPHGFDKMYWDAEEIKGNDFAGIRFKRFFPDGESGFPGNRNVSITYTLNQKNELELHYTMDSDKDTPCNMTNHGYWNLNNGIESVENHKLTIKGSHYLPVDERQIPTGELKPVKGTPMDFTEGKLIGQDINADPVGFDHNWCLDGEGFRSIALVENEETGRIMELFTDLPAVQFFAAKPMQAQPTREGLAGPCSGLCLETQFYPDGVNQKDFPDCILKAGKIFETRTVHRFSVK